MGPIAHIIIYAIIWHAVTENERKKGQMNVQIMESQEEMGKVPYHDTWLRLNMFCMKLTLDL